MAAAAKRSSANTELFIGTLRVPVGLFGTNSKPGKAVGFATAGPNGGVLKYEQRGVIAEEQTEEQPDQPVQTSDPLAADPGPEGPSLEDTVERAERIATTGRKLMDRTEPEGALVDGEFRQVLVEQGTGEVVEPEDVRRGVRLDDGSFVDCTEQLDAIVERTKLDRIEVVKCIDATQIRAERTVGAYYVGAQETEGLPYLRLFFEALKRRREVAVVKYTTRSRQQLGVIGASAKGQALVLRNLVWAEDWRDVPAKAQVGKVAVNETHVDAMEAILEAMHGHVDDLDELRDDALALREELRARAEHGEMAEVVEPRPDEPGDDDLEAALEASLEAVRVGKV